MLFSCAKEELDYGKLNLIGDPKPITVNATLPKSANLEKTLVDSDGKVCWEPNDTIVVNGSTLQITSILPSGTEAVFTGTAGEMIGTNGYWATYPFAPQQSDYTNNSVAVTLPATQTYSSGDRLQNYMVAYAVSADPENISFAFKNLCCIIKFQVKSQNNDNQSTNKLSKIEVVSNQSIAGTAMVQMDGSGNPAFTSWTNGGKILTLNCGNTQLNNGEGVIFSVMLPAGTQSLSVKFYDATGKYMRKTVSGASLARSCMYNLSATLNATEVSGFSVSSTKKVYFSPGNLQWSATNGGTIATTHATADSLGGAGTWRFAEHQYDYIGSANSKISASYTGWIDLFGWGTSGNKEKYPYMTSTKTADYGNGKSSNIAETYYDWGVYNAIYNPQTGKTDDPGTWRTLTNDEWSYLFETRTNASELYKNGVTVCGKSNCLIIAPDNYTGTIGTLYNASAWSAAEAAGLVCLPAAGYRHETTVSKAGSHGYYWSSTYYDDYNSAYVLWFYSGKVGPGGSGNGIFRCRGLSVRLVKDVVE